MEKQRDNYTPYFCEENVWYLAQSSTLDRQDARVIFVSNQNQTVALAGQRAGKPPDHIVVWDYHVILLTHHPAPIVWDLDTKAECPIPATVWVERIFRRFPALPEEFKPLFYVTPLELYVTTFSSDE